VFSRLRRKSNKQRLLGVVPTADGWSAALIERQGSRYRLHWANHVAEAASALPSSLVRRDARSERCTSLLSSNDYSLVLVDAPDVPPAELRAAVRWRVNEMIDFHIDDAVLDIFDVPNPEGRTPRLYAVAARAAAVRRIGSDLTASGLNLETIDIPEFALRNIAAILPEDQQGVAMVALEAQRGVMSLTRQGNLFLSRRLDYGTDRLFADITPEAPFNEGALDTLIIEIQRSLDYYERHFAQPAIQTLVFAPAPRPLGEAAGYLQSQLGLNVRELNLTEVVSSDEPLDPTMQAACFTAIGAAMRTEEIAL